MGHRNDKMEKFTTGILNLGGKGKETSQIFGEDVSRREKKKFFKSGGFEDIGYTEARSLLSKKEYGLYKRQKTKGAPLFSAKFRSKLPWYKPNTQQTKKTKGGGTGRKEKDGVGTQESANPNCPGGNCTKPS
tara:strand:- start:193 stop:588 length:396 start_codon:yes stop_codon:yes gene_type:complete